jgi:hypothetical protein
MKLTTKQIRQIIKEELVHFINEGDDEDNYIVPFDNEVKKAMDELIPQHLKNLSKTFIQLLVNKIGRYNITKPDDKFFEENLKANIDELVELVIFDYFEKTRADAFRREQNKKTPKFSYDDHELAQDYIEFSDETKRVIAQLKEMMEFAIKASELKRNPKAVQKGSMEEKIFKLFDSGPEGFMQAFELIGSLI